MQGGAKHGPNFGKANGQGHYGVKKTYGVCQFFIYDFFL